MFLLAYRRTLLWGSVALLGVISTAAGLSSYLARLREQIPAGGLRTVVVAARDIAAGEMLSADMLRTAGIPAAAVADGAIRSIDTAVGSAASFPIDEGQTLTARTIGRSGPSSLVPRGMRAYAVTAELPAGSGLTPGPGDRVDVLATFPADVTGEAVSVTILRWRQVTAAPAAADASDTMGADSAFGDLGAGTSAARITLLVTPEEAERLAMAESFGRITVVLAPSRPDHGAPPDPVRAGDLGLAE